jgi:HSP20 family molecular chaperone IbpA
MGVNAQPELIKGPDFYEIIAEIRGVTSTSEIKVDYDPNTNIMRIYSIAPSTSEVKIKLPDDVSNPQVNQIQYLNGIVRIRLR